MRPKDIIMNTMSSKDIMLKKQEKLNAYERIYRDGFCKAYGIECKDRDVESFLYLVNKNILKRHNPEGVDYRPLGSMVRLWIAPHKASITLSISSYAEDNTYKGKFDEFRELVTKSPKKSENLEDRMKLK